MWFAHSCGLLSRARRLACPAGERISAASVRLMKLLSFSFPKGKEKSSKCHGEEVQDSNTVMLHSAGAACEPALPDVAGWRLQAQ